MAIGDLAEPGQEAVLRHNVAALALDRLDDDRRDLVRRHQLVEEDFIEPAKVLHPAERRVIDPRQERAEPRVVLRLRRRERDGAVRAAVECAEERDDVRPSRRMARELDRGLDHLGPAVAEVDPGLATRDLGDLREPAADLRVDRQVEVGRREMDQLGRLLLDRGDDAGMGMARRVDRDAGREVEEQVAVDVLDRQALATNRDDRIGARETPRCPRFVEGDVGPGLRARNLGDEVRNRARLADLCRNGSHQGTSNA